MQMAISLRGAIADSSTFRFLASSSSSSSSSSSPSLHFTHNFIPCSSSSSSLTLPLTTNKLAISSRNKITCSAVQESSTSTTAAAETKEVNAAPKAEAPAKKPPAKAPLKPLPQMMEEDVIPSLKAILEAQQDLSDIELVFQDNKLEGSFLKQGNPHSFWAFFPDGVLTGPKGFSLSSYNSKASTVEPFLIDEKKITAKLVIFWVEKRLAAQGIIPVWKD